MNLLYHLVQNIKIIKFLIKLNKNVLFNSFKRTDTWLRVLTIILLVYVFYHSAVSGSFAALLFKEHIHPGDLYYFHIVNIGLFALFVLNILSSIYLSASKYSESIGTKLSYYPVSTFKNVLFGILAATFDLYNLMFMPFYLVAFLVIGSINSFLGFILSLAIFFLFVLLIGSIIYFFKNLYLLILSNQRQKKVLSYIGIALLLSIFIYPGGFKGIFEKYQNIVAISKILGYLPSGVLAKYITQTNETILDKFLSAFIYLILFNIFTYKFNIWAQKKLKLKKNKSGINKRNKKEGKLILFVKNHVANPVNKKDLIYSFRSTREFALTLSLIFVYVTFVFYSFHEVLLHEIKRTDIASILILFIIYHLLLILKFCGNIFGYDYGGVTNYFGKPIKYSEFIISKTNSFNYLIACNFILGTVCLILLNITWYNYLFFTSLIIITYFLVKPLGVLLSINFPYRIRFYGMQGMNVSFLTLIIVLMSIAIIAGISYLLFKELIPLDKIIISFIFLIVSYYLFKSNNKILASFKKQLVYKKEKIISTCS